MFSHPFQRLFKTFATIASLPPSSIPKPKPKMQANFESAILPRLNVFNEELQAVRTFGGPSTGFFRNNFCDASPLDPASHTVAAILTPAFLRFSAERGNNLASLFSTSGPLSPASSFSTNSPAESTCKWCICASRWKEALMASATHEKGDEIVPKVVLEATHYKALEICGKEELERFAVGGDGDGGAGAGAGGGGGDVGAKVRERAGR